MSEHNGVLAKSKASVLASRFQVKDICFPCTKSIIMPGFLFYFLNIFLFYLS
jgi:hypothetical protein